MRYLCGILIATAFLIAGCSQATPVPLPDAGITGQVISASDVSTMADAPLPRTGVIAVPAEMFTTLVDPRVDLSRLQGSEIPQEAVAGADVSGPTGEFALDVPPGDYYVCVGPFDVNEVPVPTPVNGCKPVTVPDEGVTRIELVWEGVRGLEQ